MRLDSHRYQKLLTIASGGMATVYLGRMMIGEVARTVAIKVMHPHLAEDAEMVAMFLDEARLATRLKHPNLVGVFDVDMLGRELIIIMDYVEGMPLSKLLRRLRRRHQALPVGVAARVVCDALDGLHAAHEQLDEQGAPMGLVHRDVSPHNVLVGTDGVTRITDFGVALATGRLASTRPDGTIKGKLQYLAPEQVGRRTVDRRVDVFAAGIVLWECLTGARLFDASTEAEIVTRVLRDPIAPPSLSRSEVSTAIDEVCLKALERDPARRYATAAEFAEALRVAAGSKLADAAETGHLVSELAHATIVKHRDTLRIAEEGGAHAEHPTIANYSPQRPTARSNKHLVGVALASVLVGVAVARLALPSRAAPASADITTAPAAELAPSASAPVTTATTAIETPMELGPGPDALPAEKAPARNSPSAKAQPPARVDGGARGGTRKPPAKPGGARPFMPQDL